MITYVHQNIFDAMTIFITQMGPGKLNINFTDAAREADVDMFRDEANSDEERLAAVRYIDVKEIQKTSTKTIFKLFLGDSGQIRG